MAVSGSPINDEDKHDFEITYFAYTSMKYITELAHRYSSLNIQVGVAINAGL